VETGLVARTEVTELGAVLAGEAPGRQSDEDITAFDSTGLAIQDLAISIEVVNRYRDPANAAKFPGVETIEVG
jgi:alanine dehydrogenase